MSKHTPGPWRVFEYENDDTFYEHKGMWRKTIEVRFENTPIRMVPIITAGYVQVAQPSYFEVGMKAELEQIRANACLIAAAPELLDTLKAAVENCGCALKERLSGHLTTCPAPEWEAVIAKAEGRDE